MEKAAEVSGIAAGVRYFRKKWIHLHAEGPSGHVFLKIHVKS
jgi:hypothetical protein